MTHPGRAALMMISLLLVLVNVQPAFATPAPIRVAAPLSVTLSFAPNPVSQNTQTKIQVSISGGGPPYFLWFNSSIPNCNPPGQPFTQNGGSGSYNCTPISSGVFPAHLDVADNAGDHGSASASLTVNSNSGGSGGNGTGGGTGGFNLTGLQDFLPILLIVMVVFLASVVAIAASLIALAILVPRRLKQLRKAIQGEPLKKVKTEEPKAPKPDDQPPKDDL